MGYTRGQIASAAKNGGLYTSGGYTSGITAVKVGKKMHCFDVRRTIHQADRKQTSSYAKLMEDTDGTSMPLGMDATWLSKETKKTNEKMKQNETKKSSLVVF